jgi:hypothetical protein
VEATAAHGSAAEIVEILFFNGDMQWKKQEF